ncbi:MAG: site-2 protease family protein [candidate division Zixibacteria bacterium]|nr:site-2 protease family protein [candidate division Zixibacteria bacterium]
MFGADFIQRAIVYGPVILFSLTIHEFAHAWSAHKFGDDTARNLGRMSLNPLVHLTLMGTAVMVLSQFSFGWAKPVPVNPMNLRNPRVADRWISAAGPLSNVALALVAGLTFQLIAGPGFDHNALLPRVLMAGVYINIALAVFNMLPLFPLDGSHILRSFVPDHHQGTLERFEQIAPFVLLILIITGAFWIVAGPVVYGIASLLLGF